MSAKWVERKMYFLNLEYLGGEIMCLKDCECFNICLFSYSKEGLRLKMDTQEGCTDDKIIHNLQKKKKKETDG